MRRRSRIRPRSDLINDATRYHYAVYLGKAGQYLESIEVLKSIADQSDPKVLTYMGYNHRNLGDFKTGVSYYQKALAKDPNYVLAREYLGEGYLKVGKLGLAKQQLAEITKRCGISCEAYIDLASEIAKHMK